MTEKTSKEAASAAARVLRDPNASEDAKSAAGSALTQYEGVLEVSEGVSLRDHFAGLAMQAIVSSRDIESGYYSEPTVADSAYAMADVMLKARVS